MRKALISQGFSVWHLNRPQHLVGAGGFEPPKSKTTDLQSAPFGHSGTLPYLVIHWSWWTDATFFQKFAVLSASRSHFAPKNITP